ncbi:MAG TPA: Ig-like domain-containing protein [Terriglobales bacterium]|jgi:hypothetical protein|nr:Ig-like domain-containing protein [Terriglobales bacterium]
MLTGRKLALTLVFTAFVALATGISCRGFFVNPTLSSIAVSPASVNVAIGATTTLQVYGTYSDGTREQVTSGVSWSVSPTGIATITGSGNGNVTGVAVGATTATASAQAITGTASITVAGNVTTITASPSSQQLTVGSATPAYITFAASPGPPDFITQSLGGTLVISPTGGNLVCVDSTDPTTNDPAEACTDTADTSSVQYSIYMTYVNGNGDIITSNTVTINVTP